jgi:hypothetical protein
MWKRTSSSTMRNGDWVVIKFNWKDGARYCLWNKDTFMGRYGSADEAKGEVK